MFLTEGFVLLAFFICLPSTETSTFACLTSLPALCFSKQLLMCCLLPRSGHPVIIFLSSARQSPLKASSHQAQQRSHAIVVQNCSLSILWTKMLSTRLVPVLNAPDWDPALLICCDVQPASTAEPLNSTTTSFNFHAASVSIPGNKTTAVLCPAVFLSKETAIMTGSCSGSKEACGLLGVEPMSRKWFSANVLAIKVATLTGLPALKCVPQASVLISYNSVQF